QTKKRGVFYLILKISSLNRLASYDEYTLGRDFLILHLICFVHCDIFFVFKEMVMFSKNWLSSLFSMIENGSVCVTHACGGWLSTAVYSVAKWRMRNVRDYDPPNDYHCVATAPPTSHYN